MKASMEASETLQLRLKVVIPLLLWISKMQKWPKRLLKEKSTETSMVRHSEWKLQLESQVHVVMEEIVNMVLLREPIIVWR